MSFNCQRELIVAFLVLKDPFFFDNRHYHGLIKLPRSSARYFGLLSNKWRTTGSPRGYYDVPRKCRKNRFHGYHDKVVSLYWVMGFPALRTDYNTLFLRLHVPG